MQAFHGGVEMGLASYLIGILNLITTFFSMPVLALGIRLALRHDTECERFLQWRVIVLGFFILLVSLVGLVGSWYEKARALLVYVGVILLLIVLLLCLAILALVVTSKGARVSEEGLYELYTTNHSSWLQEQLVKPRNWDLVKSCMARSNVCRSLTQAYHTLDALLKAHMSPIQSGCCKPPSACNFTFMDPVQWEMALSTSADADCLKWRNDQLLCFDCNSCKAGVLQSLKKAQRKIAIVSIMMLVFLSIVYSIGCCAVRSILKKSQNYESCRVFFRRAVYPSEDG